MKNTFFMLFFSIAISFIACGGSGENDENLLAGNGNTEKPKEDESQEPVVCSITPIGELNQGTPIINSHADVTKRSSLMMNYRMLVTADLFFHLFCLFLLSLAHESADLLGQLVSAGSEIVSFLLGSAVFSVQRDYLVYQGKFSVLKFIFNILLYDVRVFSDKL